MKYDMFQYLCGVKTNSPVLRFQNGENIQVQREGARFLYVKGHDVNNAQWESLIVTPDWILRDVDTSPDWHTYYESKRPDGTPARWLPRYMEVGQEHIIIMRLTYRHKDDGRILSDNHGPIENRVYDHRIRLVQVFDEYTTRGGVRLENVAVLKGNLPGDIDTEYWWFAEGHGLVEWRRELNPVHNYAVGFNFGVDKLRRRPVASIHLPPISFEETPMTYTHQITQLTGRLNVRGVPGGPVLYTLERRDQFNLTGEMDRAEFNGTNYTWHEVETSSKGGKGWFADVNTLVVAPALPVWVDDDDSGDDPVLELGPNLLADPVALDRPPVDVRAGGLNNQRMIAIPAGYDIHIDQDYNGEWPFFMWNTDTGGYQADPSGSRMDMRLIAGRNIELQVGAYYLDVRVDGNGANDNFSWGIAFNLGGQLYSHSHPVGTTMPRFNAEDHAGMAFRLLLTVDEPVTFNSIGLSMTTTWPQNNGFIVPRLLTLRRVISAPSYVFDAVLVYPHDFPLDLPGPVDPDPDEPGTVHIQLPELRVTVEQRDLLRDVFEAIVETLGGADGR